MNLQCPSVARPNNPLGEFFERPLGELLERSTRRAFQTICLASLPNGPTGEPPEQFDQRTSQAVLCASREHRRIRMPRCDWRIRKCISQWPHNACPHRPADEPPSATLPSHHRPHDEPPSATPTNRHQPRRRPFPIFQKTSHPFSMCLAKTQRTKGTTMNDFSSKLGGKRGSGPLNPLPLR